MEEGRNNTTLLTVNNIPSCLTTDEKMCITDNMRPYDRMTVSQSEQTVVNSEFNTKTQQWSSCRHKGCQSHGFTAQYFTGSMGEVHTRTSGQFERHTLRATTPFTSVYSHVVGIVRLKWVRLEWVKSG